MLHKQEPANRAFISPTLGIRMLTGLLIGLAIISFYIFGASDPRPEWGTFWRVRPLIITPLAGAMCGAGNHLLRVLLPRPRYLAAALGVVVYVVGLWLGTVLGLAGTMWN